MHPAIVKGATAVVTGGASGIGLAACRNLAALGMRVCIADRAGPALDAALDAVIAAGRAADVMAVPTDVTDPAQLTALADRAEEAFGPVTVLMNNAGIQLGSNILDTEGTWQRILDTNLMGVVRGCQIFAPRMIAAGRPGLIVNTGSKQGITTPPGDPAYNLAKAGVKVFTEALQHELRGTEGCLVEARLFVPGFVFTPLTARGRTTRPEGAWTAEETVDYLLKALAGDSFYILCPDAETDRAIDAKRILWAAGDIVEDRPPLSRWHPDHAAAFARWMAR